MVKSIIILGTGGNCIDILDTINEINLIEKKYRVIGFLDDDKTKWGTNIYDIKVLGGLDSAIKYGHAFFINGIGSPNNFWEKEKIINKTGLGIDRFETIIHPKASVSKFSIIGKGTVILQQVTIASNVKIGNHVIVLANSVINHDDKIEDFVSIASGVCITGGVSLEKSCYIDSGSTIIGNIKIGKNSLVGMGSVVLKDVIAKSIVVGNPAKFLRSIN
jgi:sugar O-acyltransferase (sialic acid O-acetyltransferase NeuD family)